jgi:uncharacterized membrane protein YccF (DUF307 family)
MLSLIGNLLWIFLGGGIFIFVFYLLGSLALIITIVGIPFGIQTLKLSILGLAPFGKEVEATQSFGGLLAIVMNVIWIVFGGFWITAAHLVFALLCAITIVGLPFARQHLKLAELSLTPFGKTIV